jgi:cyclic dehypoxanthinyl futalosine synthase
MTVSSSWVGSLLYGADDFDLLIEDEATQLAGVTINLNFVRLLMAARPLGFTPTYRHAAPGWNTPPPEQ